MFWEKMSAWTDISLESLRGWGIAAGFAVGAVLVGLVLHKILTGLLRRWGDREAPLFGGLRLHLDPLGGPLKWLLPGLCLTAVVPVMPLSGGVRDALAHAVTLWVIAAAAATLIAGLAVLREAIAGRYTVDVKDNLRARQVQTQLRVIHRVVAAVIIGVTLAVMLTTFEQVKEVGVSLLASAGVLGIILGFAAQRSVATLLAGVQIALTQPIRLDDVVIVEGEWGWIEEITLTYVVVRIWDQRRLIVPIQQFIEKPFQNWTRVSADILGTVYIYADYTLPVSGLRTELERIVRESSDWDERVVNMQVTGAGDQTVEIRALMSAADSPAAWNLRCRVREQLIEYLQREHPRSLPRTRVSLESRAESPRPTSAGERATGATEQIEAPGEVDRAQNE